jgi:hypothetical protein
LTKGLLLELVLDTLFIAIETVSIATLQLFRFCDNKSSLAASGRDRRGYLLLQILDVTDPVPAESPDDKSILRHI